MEYIHAALLLHKLGKEVGEENVKGVLSAAGVEVDESKVKSLVTSLKGVDIDKELESASLVAASPSEGTGKATEGKAEKKEEKLKEEKKEAAAEGLSALFG